LKVRLQKLFEAVGHEVDATISTATAAQGKYNIQGAVKA